MKVEEKWWHKSVVYQVYPKSFMDADGDGLGDIKGITQKLDYIKLLGVDVIWISPFYTSPGKDNGYDISDYQGIQPEFGTMADFEELLVAAHNRGLKIILDLVVNHSSDQHPWFIESRSNRGNDKRDYYIWKDGKEETPPNNWGALFGGSAWTKDEQTGQYYLHLFSPHQPDLNWESSQLRQAVYSMMRWWLDKGIDGFRMDVISLISKHPDFPDGEITRGAYGNPAPYVANGPKVHDYLKEMRRQVLSSYDTLTVGEASGVTIEEAVSYANLDGNELDMVFQFEHMDLDGGESFKWNLRKINLIELKQTLSKWQITLHQKARNSLYWCNHDQPRILSRLGDEGHYREKSAKMLATCLHMMEGTPYIYQGEELGMTNAPFETLADFRDLESINAYHTYTSNGRFTEDEMMSYLRYKSRDNARTPMQWSKEKNAGFTAGTPWIMVNPNYLWINAEEQINNPDSVFHYYRQLIALRKVYPVIVSGSYELLAQDDESLYIYKRHYQNQELLVVCNFSDKAISFPLSLEQMCSWTYLLGNESESCFLREGIVSPYEGAIFYREN